jgi:FkbM family methyltransferase
VAVEANPALCRAMQERFSSPIRAGRLRIENCVLTAGEEAGAVDFYLHKRRHVLGQFPAPPPAAAGDYELVRLPARTVMYLVQRHGPAYYIKIDIEGYDEAVLRTLFRSGVRPPYISAESASIAVLATMMALGEYRAFKLTEGATVGKLYGNAAIAVAEGVERHRFPPHSAGPFGEDIPGPWMSADALFEQLAARGLGWRDIHATSLAEPADSHGRQRRAMLRHPRAWLASRFARKR